MLSQSEREVHIRNIYKQIETKFEHNVIRVLKLRDVIPNHSTYNIQANFHPMDYWKITTSALRDYSVDGEILIKEDLLSLKGRFNITIHLIPMEPAFSFVYEVNGNKISFNQKEIKEIIERKNHDEEWSTFIFDSKENELKSLYDKQKAEKIEKLKKQIIPALTQIGFPEEERNLMILGALSHDDFSPDLSIEGAIGLALKVRGEGL